jgi:hypothetical protein
VTFDDEARHLDVDLRTGVSTPRPLTDAEKADATARRVISAQREADETAQRTRLAQARPPAAIVGKLLTGTALTPAELQVTVRWLALRELRELQGG